MINLVPMPGIAFTRGVVGVSYSFALSGLLLIIAADTAHGDLFETGRLDDANSALENSSIQACEHTIPPVARGWRNIQYLAISDDLLSTISNDFLGRSFAGESDNTRKNGSLRHWETLA